MLSYVEYCQGINSVLERLVFARINEAMNATATQMPIKRHILISSGEAMVGNFGGLDSSVEITALGSPVNFLSRLDDLTKAPEMGSSLEPGNLILCQRSAETLTRAVPGLQFQSIDLQALNLSVRDFPETTIVYTLEPNDAHYATLVEAYRLIQCHDGVDRREQANGFATEV